MKRKIILCASILVISMRVAAQCPTSGTISANCSDTDWTPTGNVIINSGVTVTLSGNITLNASRTITATGATITAVNFTEGYGTTNYLIGGDYTFSGTFTTAGGSHFSVDGSTIGVTGAASFSGNDIYILNTVFTAASVAKNVSTTTITNSTLTTNGTGDLELEEATVSNSVFNVGGDLKINSGTTTIDNSDLNVGLGYSNDTGQEALTMNGGGNLYLNNNTTLDVKGDVANNALYIDNSHAVITGNFDNYGDEVLEVSNGGSISIGGNFNNGGGGNTTAESGGTIEVDGDYDNSGGGNTTVDGGGMVVGGTYSGADPTVTGGAASGCSGGSGGCCGSACSSMPVSLLSFDVTAHLDHVNLSWKTASELDNDHFNIYRSTNGVDFEILDRVKGNGTTNEQHSYELKDFPSQKGIYYYQLEQVDYDGTNEIFPIKKVNFNLSQNALAIYPMPLASGSDFYISLQEENILAVTVLDISGRLGFDLEFQEEPGRVKIYASRRGLNPGIYVIKITTELGRYSQKLRVI
ncbi:MAG: T9SS type A sorting domain-containing protein [Reichenbachiella sp.]|uniref:T9SS type A sorting domain-containing protein n=1 Tax=Reichenbachiella sp. TaxID=2184521 RepID=UPI0032993973